MFSLSSFTATPTQQLDHPLDSASGRRVRSKSSP